MLFEEGGKDPGELHDLKQMAAKERSGWNIIDKACMIVYHPFQTIREYDPIDAME